MIRLRITIIVLGIAFWWLMRRYERTKAQAWLYAAMVVMLVEVEMRKERDRRLARRG